MKLWFRNTGENGCSLAGQHVPAGKAIGLTREQCNEHETELDHFQDRLEFLGESEREPTPSLAHLESVEFTEDQNEALIRSLVAEVSELTDKLTESDSECARLRAELTDLKAASAAALAVAADHSAG